MISEETVRIYNKTLEPNLWDENRNLKPEIRIDLLKIAQDFYKSTDFKSEIIDILLLGSSINFNWTPESDIDVHIVIDIKKEGLDPEHYRKFLDALGGKWNEDHDISIMGHEVEVYLQDITEKNSTIEKARKHASMFSLLQNKWLIEPKHENITLDKESIRSAYYDIKSKIDSVISDRDLEALKDIMKYLRDYRNKGLESEGGEFSTENIVFKALRHTGMLEKLKTAINSIYDRMVSIAEHKEYVDNLVYVDTKIFDNIINETMEDIKNDIGSFTLVGSTDRNLNVYAMKQKRGEEKLRHKMLYNLYGDLDPITGIDWRYLSDLNELIWWDWPSIEMADATKKYLKNKYGVEHPKFTNMRSIEAKKRHFYHDLDLYYKYMPSTSLEEDILFETMTNTVKEKALENFIVTGTVSHDLDIYGQAYRADQPIITHGMLKRQRGNWADSIDWRYRADENAVYFWDRELNDDQKQVVFDFLKSRFGVKTKPSYILLTKRDSDLFAKSHKPAHPLSD